jgi:hypothetical protein
MHQQGLSAKVKGDNKVIDGEKGVYLRRGITINVRRNTWS